MDVFVGMGLVDVWVYEFVDVWINGCVELWARGCGSMSLQWHNATNQAAI